MTSEEFIREVQKSSQYYEKFEEDYNRFQIYQQKAAHTLQILHNLCEKNKIHYQLAFGSLLGAIRDNGQIPWDYDIDIIIPTQEREKFVKCLEKLPQEFYAYSVEKNSSCEHFITRVAPKGYDTHFLHVDVFYISGLPNNKSETQKYRREIKELTLLYKAKKFDFRSRGSSSKKEMCMMAAYKIKGIPLKAEDILNKYNSIAARYPIETSQEYCLADRFSDWYSFPSVTVFDTVLKSTAIGELRIPKDYDCILKIEYGNYMSIPSIESRMTEFKRHYKLLNEKYPL